MNRLLKAITLSLLALLVAVFIFALGWSWWVNGQVDAMEVNDYQLNAPGQFVQVDGFELHYQLRGQPLKETGGVPVLMLHGFSGSGAELTRLAPLLESTHGWNGLRTLATCRTLNNRMQLRPSSYNFWACHKNARAANY